MAKGSTVGAIGQESTNYGSVANQAPELAMSVGFIGDGASASISASGAVASVSVSLNTSSISDGPYGIGATPFTFGDIKQTAINHIDGSIVNAADGTTPLVAPNVMTVGGLSGIGASASISASGAVASVSFSSIFGTATAMDGPPNPIYRWDQSFGNIDQTATNYANVTNNGVINIGPGVIVDSMSMTGVSSSASVGATGAATAFAVSSIADPILNTLPSSSPVTTALPPSITQTASNSGAITNSGNINFTGATAPVMLGVGASASVSATGAVSSVSYRSVNNGSTRAPG